VLCVVCGALKRVSCASSVEQLAADECVRGMLVALARARLGLYPPTTLEEDRRALAKAVSLPIQFRTHSPTAHTLHSLCSLTAHA
jgi:hypothetical protein